MPTPALIACAALLCWALGVLGARPVAAAPRAAAPATGPAAPGADWAQVIAAVSPAVVSVRMDRPIAFDTDAAGNSYATGFVVDAERGILLTNRHVVGAGPSRAEAVFLNNEEVPLQPLYRDPVHDFGFYRFDPAALRYQARVALHLDPTAAKVGLEVRVIGNDAGEKISILSGTIARLDRAAPVYGRGRYNDFNTFYIQAASGTSGGSSGSPVIGPNGAVVALNAGANRSSAASFFLPLDRVVRALSYVQRGDRPPRGTWRVSLAQRSWDELRRLGLSPAQEASLRAAHPALNGLLVVDEVLPGAEAEGLLAAGDILVELSGQPIADYAGWEAILDDHVGQPLEVVALRGGVERRVRVPTGDLHALTPEAWVEVGGAVLHPLSYQKALGFSHPVEGVFLADRGYLFEGSEVPAGAVLRAVDGAAVPDLDALWAALGRLPDRQPFIVRYTLLSDPGRERLAQVWMDRRWFPLRRCAWSQVALAWPCVDAAAPPVALEPPPVATAPLASPDRRARRALSALVMVEHTLPMGIDGVLGRSFRGAGVVIDADAGWVLTDRDTVPSSVGDVRVVLAGGAVLPADVLWLHPTENLAVVRYNPDRILGDRPTALRLAARPLDRGDAVLQVGLDRDHQPVVHRARVTERRPWTLAAPNPPVWVPTNFEILRVDEAMSSAGGVLLDRRGRVGALWASFVDRAGSEPDSWFAGVPSAELAIVVAQLRANVDSLFVPGSRVEPLPLRAARALGLSDARAAAVARRPHAALLSVARVPSAGPADGVLRAGDVLLDADLAPLTTVSQLDAAAAAGRPIHLRVLRDGAELDLVLQPHGRSALGTVRALSWEGALLQDVPVEVFDHVGLRPGGVWVAETTPGSPASRYKLRAGLRVLAVNDQPTADLDALLRVLPPGDAPVRLQVQDLDGRQSVLSLKPAAGGGHPVLWVRGPAGWASTTLGPLAPAGGVAPAGPLTPAGPSAPAGPMTPAGPSAPSGPSGPLTPAGPLAPEGARGAADPTEKPAPVGGDPAR